jgi:hypothetical protein
MVYCKIQEINGVLLFYFNSEFYMSISTLLNLATISFTFVLF